MNMLQKLIREHKNTPIPPLPENDDFSDWVTDALLFETYYIGLATSLESGSKIYNITDKERLKINHEELDRAAINFKNLTSITEEDGSIYYEWQKRLTNLISIANAVQQYK